MDSPIGFPIGAVLAHSFERRGLAQIGRPSERGLELVASFRGFLGILSRLPVGGDVLLSIITDCEDDDMGGSERFADCLGGRYWDSFHGDSEISKSITSWWMERRGSLLVRRSGFAPSITIGVLTIGLVLWRERHHGFGVARKFPVRICQALQAPIQINLDVVGFGERGHFAALDAVVSWFHVGVFW